MKQLKISDKNNCKRDTESFDKVNLVLKLLLRESQNKCHVVWWILNDNNRSDILNGKVDSSWQFDFHNVEELRGTGTDSMAMWIPVNDAEYRTKLDKEVNSPQNSWR